MAAKRIVFDHTRVGPWVFNKTEGVFEPNSSSALGLEEDGRLIAGVVFDNFNTRSIAMHVAAEDGARWMTRQFLWMCFDYPFNQAKVDKIIGLVDSTNLQARRFDEHLGFTLEATLRDAGRHGDLLLYTMNRQQCRFIGEPNGRKSISSSNT